jgi:hypothetical protein
VLGEVAQAASASPPASSSSALEMHVFGERCALRERAEKCNGFKPESRQWMTQWNELRARHWCDRCSMPPWQGADSNAANSNFGNLIWLVSSAICVPSANAKSFTFICFYWVEK